MRITIILIISCYCLFAEAEAQKLFSLVDNTVSINTRNAPAGNTEVVEVSLPAKTQSFIYRIIIFKKDQWKTITSLSALLDSMGAKNVSQTSDFRQFAVLDKDNPIASAFIFSNYADADNFFLDKPGSRACKNLQRINAVCLSSRQCLGKKIYFGFSNGNAVDEIDVRLEVVAVAE